MICVILFVLIGIFVLPDCVQAGYLDPGSGSTLAQGLVAAIAALGRWWRKFLSIFGKGSSNAK